MIKDKLIVIKLGTSTLTHETGKLNLRKMDIIVRAVSDIQGAGNKVIIVTSAAISVGTAKMGLDDRPQVLKEKMAVSAVGQCKLMHTYDTLFSEYNRTISQILLTSENVENEVSAKCLSDTFDALLEMDVIPIVNENDSVSTTEIESGKHKLLGDNDTLSAIVAEFCHADLLIILSDVDGLYDSDPRKNSGAKLIKEVTEVTPELIESAGGAGTMHGTGGMITKLEAGKIALDSGFDMVITNSDEIENLYRIADGEKIGTWFSSKGKND